MNDLELKKIAERAKAYASKRGRASNADDFAQEAMMYYFKHGQINYKWAFASYMRQSFGDLRFQSGRLKSKARLECNEILHEITSDYSIEHQLEEAKIAALIDSFSGRNKFFVKAILSGESHKAIAEKYNITASRASQIIKRIRGILEILIITHDKDKAFVCAYAF